MAHAVGRKGVIDQMVDMMMDKRKVVIEHALREHNPQFKASGIQTAMCLLNGATRSGNIETLPMQYASSEDEESGDVVNSALGGEGGGAVGGGSGVPKPLKRASILVLDSSSSEGNDQETLDQRRKRCSAADSDWEPDAKRCRVDDLEGKRPRPEAAPVTRSQRARQGSAQGLRPDARGPSNRKGHAKGRRQGGRFGAGAAASAEDPPAFEEGRFAVKDLRTKNGEKYKNCATTSFELTKHSGMFTSSFCRYRK
ncbi:hypothetical protein CYMTET_28243 [Cymbomonas tetramitiformis]|uniref:Uncharacterized protein n=1 Tax=Cymbomonas tetramitiformis TaxID=36881 RepID=A0AAE0FND0_9CHLO|nr:hypothetical protein CYMTET_29706 [Cymbomonas tetramitiformis]KAK3262929.1 hypothetical protein CYMTET_28243 [Cymbomonas tetramitiformis]